MSIPGDQLASDIDRLRVENASLRHDISLATPPSGRTETLERLEKENEMLKNQKRILEYCKGLFDTEEGRQEALFALQFFYSIPLPLWTSTLQARISYWNEFAERTYHHDRQRALGKNFIDLFVSPAEKEQARDDLISIIFGEEGAEHFNLCKDKDRHGRQVYLVTCCFPVFDPRTKEIVQAEVSFDLRQLEALQTELSDMYDRHRKKEDETREHQIQRETLIIKNLVEDSFLELRGYCNRERDLIKKRIEKNREIIEGRGATAAEKETHRKQLESHRRELTKLDQLDLDIQREITSCSTIDQHNALKKKIWEMTRKDV